MSDTPPTLGINVSEVIQTEDGLAGTQVPSSTTTSLPIDAQMLRSIVQSLKSPWHMRSGKFAVIDASVLGVKLWYADGSCVCIPVEDIESGWLAAPDSGVQVVAIFPREQRAGRYYPEWFASRDLYAYSPARQLILETNRQADLPPDAIVKTGSEMDKDEFRKLYNGAMQDHEF